MGLGQCLPLGLSMECEPWGTSRVEGPRLCGPRVARLSRVMTLCPYALAYPPMPCRALGSGDVALVEQPFGTVACH